MSSTTRIILSLSPDKLSAALVRRGRVLRAEAIELDATEWSEHWSDGMMRLDQPLRQLMSRFPARSRKSASLLYHSPTTTKQVYTFDLASAAAREAATSKLRESVGYGDPVETEILSRHLKDAKQTTVLAYSEREELLRAIYAWLNRCGVEVDTMMPTSVAVMRTATEIAAGTEPGTAVFYIDADSIVMVYADAGELKLIRPADMGYRKLVEAYGQAVNSIKPQKSNAEGQEADEADPIELNSRAHDLLFEQGIPLQSVHVDGIDLRTTVFPYIAPVLQRICIDVKQTIRFGLPGDAQPKHLMICGPGASIPGLSKAIAQSIDMHIKTEPGVEGCDPRSPFGRGTLEYHLVESRGDLSGLLPDIAQDAQIRNTLNHGLMIGAALAVIALGAEFGYTTLRQQEVHTRMQEQAPRLRAVNEFQQRCTAAAEVSTVLGDVCSLVTQSLDSVPQWHYPLAQLGQLSGDEIRIHELRGEKRDGASVIEINGLSVSDADIESGSGLDRFVGAVESMPHVQSVSLGGTSRIRVNEEQWGMQFSMKVTLAPQELPYAAYARANAVTNGAQP